MHRGGSALTQILVAASLAGGLAVLIAQVSNRTAKVGERATQISTLASFNQDGVLIRKDIPRWLRTLRDPSVSATMSTVANCIPTSVPPNPPPSSVCPSTTDNAAIDDSTILAKANGRAVNFVDLMNVTPERLTGVTSAVTRPGHHIAGTLATPVFFDNQGQVCVGAANPVCRFRSVGYMIRENSGTGDPGEVSFMVKVDANPGAAKPDDAPLAPLYLTFDLGEAWKSSVKPAGCAPGQTQGFAADNSLVCYDTPTCAAGEYFAGWNSAPGSGARVCRPLPARVCPAGQALYGVQADGSPNCRAPVNTGAWSAWGGCSKTCGGGVQTRTCSWRYRDPPWTKIPCAGPSSQACNTQPCITQWAQGAYPPGGYYSLDGKHSAIPGNQLQNYGPGTVNGCPVPGAGAMLNIAGHICAQSMPGCSGFLVCP